MGSKKSKIKKKKKCKRGREDVRRSTMVTKSKMTESEHREKQKINKNRDDDEERSCTEGVLLHLFEVVVQPEVVGLLSMPVPPSLSRAGAIGPPEDRALLNIAIDRQDKYQKAELNDYVLNYTRNHDAKL